MLFYVEAIDTRGKKIKKFFQVSNEEELISILEFNNFVPLKIRQFPEILNFLIKRKGKITRREIIEVLENLHLVVKSGLPLNVGLMDIAKDVENETLKEVLTDIAYKLQIGYNLSKAIEPYSSYFTDVVVSLFKIGEETGNLDRTLKDAAEHLKRIEDLMSKTKQALIYPAFAFVSITGAMIFWLVYVLPKIMDVFKEFNMQLPLTTIIIMKMSEFTQKYLLYIIGFLIVLFILIKIFRKKSIKFKLFTDKLTLRIPIFGLIIRNFNYAFFSEYMKLMISAGLPLYQALEIMEKAMNNEVFKLAIRNVKDKVSLGNSFSSALMEENVFPALIIRMVNIGEQTGQLENQLEYISDYYYDKVDYISQNIAKMIEPILIGVLGLFLLILVLGLIGPIYQLISNVGRMS